MIEAFLPFCWEVAKIVLAVAAAKIAFVIYAFKKGIYIISS